MPSSVMKRSRRSSERSRCLPSSVATRFSKPSAERDQASMLLKAAAMGNELETRASEVQRTSKAAGPHFE
jgi:hypothetical protein